MHVHGNVSSKPGTSRCNEKNLWEEPTAAMLEGRHVEAKERRVPLHSASERDGTACGGTERGAVNHGNRPWLDWAAYVADRVQSLLAECNGGTRWTVVVRHLEHVKSYAPHVDHLVVDLECRPGQVLQSSD